MKTNLLKSIFISLILLVGATSAWAATIFNCGIEVNETWYKGTGTINSGNWLGNQTAFNNKDFGVITSLKLGGQYDTWDNNQKDQCSWNGNNGLKITISTESGTQKAEFRLSCYNSGFASNNNTWKTTGTINNCGDKSAFGRYTYDISSYAAGKYKMKATWFSPSGISTDATANFTIPGFTTTSKSQTFDSTPVGNNNSKTISFGTHYGTTLKTNNCSISGTNYTEFSVTSINESGVTVQFKPTSAGSKTATLTITDAHSKKCTITLSGTATLPTYTVTFNANGHGTAPTAQTVTQGNKATTPAAPTVTGYTFGGWYKEANCTNAFDFNTAITADITLYAKWTANKYTVTLDNQSATTAGTTSVSATYGSAMPEITIPSRTGYTFGGYYTDKNGGGTQYYKADGTSATNWNLEGAQTLYAKWTITNYTITYNLNGGTNNANNPAHYTIASATITLQSPTRTGYTFSGWYESSNFSGSAVTTIATGSTGNKTLYAKWTANTYTVNLDREPSTDGTASVTATYGSDMPAITKPTRTGYTFGGYYTEKNGGGTQYYKADGTSATTWNLEGAQTLYAKWTATPYNITYTNLGGATHTNAKTYTIEDAITFSEPSTRNGYTFSGWYPASIEKGSTGDKTITAQWTEKPANTIYIRANEMWKSDGAKLAVYAWNNTENTWLDVEYDDCTGNLLMAEIPAKYNTGIKFVRLNPNPTSNDTRQNNGYNFANAWNQTNDLKIPADNNNLYDLTKKYIYLKPNDNWKEASARFAAYFYKSSGGGDTWRDMTDADGDGYYSCEKPDGYDWVIFCRMNPATSANNWNNRWNQSANQGIPENNLFTVNDGQWGGKGENNNKDGATGHWDNNHWDNSQWTTYTAPTYQIQIMPCTNGTITVEYNGQTCTSTTIKQTMEVPLHAELTITLTPLNGYQPTTPQVTYAEIVGDNIYSICGPATISAEFVPKGTTKTIYLRPNDDWLKDDAIFIAHAWKDGSSDLHDYLMTTKDDDYTGSYSCTIDSKYDHVLFARINPEYKTNQELTAKWMWNKTVDLQITDDVLNEHGYRFAIGDKEGDLYNGKWEENTPIWGLTADFNLWHAEDAIFRGYPGKVDILLHSKTHQFLLYNIKTGEYCHNNGTYTRGNSGQWWTMNEQNNCKLVADVDNALYHFQMQYVTQTGTFKKQISITYPNTGVYYLAYQEGDNTKSFRKSHAINKITEGEKEDIVSFFVNVDESPYIYLLDGSNTILSTHPITETAGEHPNGAMLPSKRNSSPILNIGNGCGVEYSGVYNFILRQEGNNAEIDAEATHPYKGNYYIRTDAAEGGWNDFRQESNLMTFSTFAESHSNFNHYFCKWINNNNGTHSNVKFTIANDYSYSLSDTLNNDRFIQSEEGYLPDSANVRFGWDSRTNEVSRAYLKGSGHAKDRFLVLIGENDNLRDSVGNVITEGTGNNKGLNANEVLFLDAGNWVYQVDVKANKNTKIKLTAEYNNLVQYFKGSENEYMNLLSSDTEQHFKIRLIYDFKTNHLVVAWLPESEITTNFELSSDMMIIRRNQENAMQVHFNPNSRQVSGIGTGYAVMTFTTAHVNGNTSDYNRALYWVSFPFDVRLKEVFGFGEYGQHWIMEYYDGAARAANGLWADSDTYWKYITNPDYTLKAGQGYVLCLNLGKMGASSPVFENTDEVSLYFPSASPLQTITGEVTTADIPAHECTIERDFRYIYDSNWNLIGVPGFKDITGVGVGGSAHEDIEDPNVTAECVNFYYKYIPATNKYEATDNTKENDFQTMFSYMVQYAGTIEWSSPAFPNAPSSIAARRVGNVPSEHTLRLELLQSEALADQTIIKLQEQDATADFDMNIDMAKMMNSGANIYTMTANTNIMVGGNALPIARTTVPVGVRVDATGEYTFRMPDGTDGISVILLDNQTGAHTNMLLDEYTVILEAGTYENRFSLSVDPNRSATSVENIFGDGNEENGNKATGVKKFIIDGQLFIRTADDLFDAKGQRL